MLNIKFNISDKDSRALVCNDWVMVFPSPETARLAAAAPELFEACQVALEDGDSYRLSEDVKSRLRQAVKKAGGKPWSRELSA